MKVISDRHSLSFVTPSRAAAAGETRKLIFLLRPSINQVRRLQAEDVKHAISRDGNTLMAVECKGNGIGANTAASLEIPQRLAGCSIECEKVAFVGAGEHQSSGSR